MATSKKVSINPNKLEELSLEDNHASQEKIQANIQKILQEILQEVQEIKKILNEEMETSDEEAIY